VRAAAAELDGDATFREWRGLALLPAYSEDAERAGTVASVSHLRSELSLADALLLATPEYNHSIPGALKNALDWASRPYAENVLRGMSVAVVGASVGQSGAVRAQADLRKVLRAIGADVLESEFAVGNAAAAFTEDAGLADPEHVQVLRRLLQQLVRRSGASAAA
jgi:chromate reductase, NAD(P)H dehydrogenase (quinone)